MSKKNKKRTFYSTNPDFVFNEEMEEEIEDTPYAKQKVYVSKRGMTMASDPQFLLTTRGSNHKGHEVAQGFFRDSAIRTLCYSLPFVVQILLCPLSLV